MNICSNSRKQWNDILRELREDRDLKQSDLAAVLQTTQQVYSRYEKGINELPLHHIITICRYYHVPADYLLGLEPNLPFPKAK